MTADWTCPKCGRSFPLFAGRPPRHNCRPIPSGTLGLGDTVAAAIHWLTGIKPCRRCRRWRAWLNRVFPYRSK